MRRSSQQRLAQPRHAPQLLDQVPELAAGGRLGERIPETVGVDLRAPVVLGEDEVYEVLPGGEVLGGGAERGGAGQVRGARAQRRRQQAAQRRQARAHQRGEAGVDARAQHLGLLVGDEAQPVAALREHLCQQPLEVHPVVVEPLEQQPPVGGQRPLGIESGKRGARGALTQLGGIVGDGERAADARRDRQLGREPEVERVDGLDPQRLRLLGEAPAAGRAVRARGLRQRARARARSGRPGRARRAARATTRSRISAAALRVKVMARISPGSSTRCEERQEALRQHRGLARAGRGLEQHRALAGARARARARSSSGAGLTHRGPRPGRPRGCGGADAAHRLHVAVLAGAGGGIDARLAGEEGAHQRLEALAPGALLRLPVAARGRHRPHPRQDPGGGRDAGESHLARRDVDGGEPDHVGAERR